MMMAYPYLLYVDDGRDPDMCLKESAAFRHTPPSTRIVTSTFKPRGRFGDFRQHVDRDAMWRWMESTAVAQRNFNTVIFDDEPMRLYLDLEMEMEVELAPEVIEIMLADVLSFLDDAFASAYPGRGGGVCSEHMWSFSASTATKVSFHLHADPEQPHPTWASVMELDAFMKGHVRPLMERERRQGTERARRLSTRSGGWFIDMSVYTRHRSFKLPLCCKPGKATMQLHRAPAAVASGDTSCERKQLEVGMPQDWTTPPEQHLPRLRATNWRVVPQRAVLVAVRRSKSSPREGEAVLQLLRPQLGPGVRWSSLEFDAAAQTARGILAKRSARCPWKNDVHRSNQLQVRIAGGLMRVSCFDEACRGQVQWTTLPAGTLFAGGESESESESDNDMDVDQQLDVEQTMAHEAQQSHSQQVKNFGMPLRLDSSDGRLDVVLLDQRHLLQRTMEVPGAVEDMQRLFAHPRLGIRSPMDTAKTSAFIFYIDWLVRTYPRARVVLVTSRISLAVSLQQRMLEAGLACVSYLQDGVKPATLQQAQCVIVQLDSIGKLVPTGSIVPAPVDLVLLDEAESTLFHFQAKTLKRRSDVWQAFSHMCQRATQLILLDAHLGARSQDLLERMAEVPHLRRSCDGAFARWLMQQQQRAPTSAVRLVVNQQRTDTKRYRLSKTSAGWHRTMHDLLNHGKRLAIPCNQRRKADALAHEIRAKHPQLRVLLYTSKSSDEQKRGVGDCNTAWLQYDVVIFSPTIGAGVDFNPEEPHFDAICAWGVATVNPAREFLQMIGRVRKVKSGVVHIFLDGCKTRESHCTRSFVLDEMKRNWQTLNRTGVLDPAQRVLVDDGTVEATQVKYHQPAYVELYVHNRLELEQSRAMFADLLLDAIRSNGGMVEMVDDTMDPADAQQIRQEMRALEEQHEGAERMRLARDTWTSPADEEASRRRIDDQQATERDRRLAQRQRLVRTYFLQRVPMTAAQPPTEEEAALLADFIGQHGGEQAAERFQLFCMANEPLHCVRQRWLLKAHLQKDEHPLHTLEKEIWERLRILRGLLFVVGLEKQAPPGTAHAWEERGDVCSKHTVTTDSVQERIQEPTHAAWVAQNASVIQGHFHCKLSTSPTVKSVVSALRTVLERTVGLELVKARPAKRSRCREDGRRKAVTTWQIGDARRDELLELAYSASQHFRPEYAAAAGAEWDVGATVERMQPTFRWQALTGTERPLHRTPAPAPPPAAAPPPSCPSPGRTSRKRQRV